MFHLHINLLLLEQVSVNFLTLVPNPFPLTARYFAYCKAKLRNRGYVCFGHVMSWAVGRWCHLVQAQVKSQGRQCGICGVQIVTGIGLSSSTSFFSERSSNAPYIHILFIFHHYYITSAVYDIHKQNVCLCHLWFSVESGCQKCQNFLYC